jgi:hypothetical protein
MTSRLGMVLVLAFLFVKLPLWGYRWVGPLTLRQLKRRIEAGPLAGIPNVVLGLPRFVSRLLCILLTRITRDDN